MTEPCALPDGVDTQPSRPSTVSTSSDYPFLVHSQQTLPRNLPPNVDNKSLARQKRRRTSPEDQAILEAEYHRNPKPDKNARQELVERVALGDKEVQIWFQNRRQNDRRKSRPLLPHELISRPPLLSAPEPMTDAAEGTRANDEHGNETAHSSYVADALQAVELPEEAGERIDSSQDTPGSTSYPVVALSSQVSCETAPTATSSYSSQQAEAVNEVLPRPGYLANRRNASFVRSGSSIISGKAANDTSSDTVLPRNRGLKKSSSSIRISLTSDGNAQVLTNDDSSPSPPRSAPLAYAANTARGKLSRSQSATGLNESSFQTELEPFRDIMQRGTAGRSRDSRAWEFWCDSDSRNALAEKANQDAGGSAADAIGLIRSQSRNVLGTNSNKRNAQLLKRNSVKRLKSGTSNKPKLSRTTSELGHVGKKESADETSGPTCAEDIEIPNNESDKENWEPGQLGHPPDRDIGKVSHPKNEKMMRKVLGESNSIPSKSSSFGVMMAQEKVQRSGRLRRDAENTNPEDDPEIAEFMSASRKRSSGTNASGEDLDCVQGLLSLSQGNWR
ncbi:hypothetical protein EV356DRAFT_529541 [Viridothelium virens]|uniref:Homeobox domain-containing protein n=1 Tax=Viridothelium virens TaxID=1048519 RepID=A0A6A6HJ25_VIRVR|nr:hypothetical protein EV356DRAFT_529541 [Viridothelium virens]